MTEGLYDVIIVGAGPVGLFLAVRLKQQGLNVAIVERQKALYPLPRAVVFDHESRRLLSAAIGRARLDEVLEEVVGRGGQDGVNFVWRDANLKLIADLHWENPTRSGTPFCMGFSQPQLESLLNDVAKELVIPIFRGRELIALDQDPQAVTIVTRPFDLETEGVSKLWTGDEKECTRYAAKYLVGCDGANSTTRRLLGISNVDLGFQNDWLILDLLLKNNYIPDIVKTLGCSQICDPSRPTTVVFAGKGRRRFEFMRLPSETKMQLLQNDKIYELLQQWGYDKTNCEIERKTLYTFNARWASEFNKGRVVLAGDSLHLMPPFIGQGLNSGFRDAGALAWRLPLILSGKAIPQLLFQSYQNERLAHIRKLTEHCILLGEVICETDPQKAQRTHEALRANPPKNGYDPPLGRPGVLTEQEISGTLSMQRPLQAEKEAGPILFDEVFGTGWRLITFGRNEHAQSSLPLDPVLRSFFTEFLGGKLVNITPQQDVTGDYAKWFMSEVGNEHAVIVRPDYYIFGHAPCSGVNELVVTLKEYFLWKA